MVCLSKVPPITLVVREGESKGGWRQAVIYISVSGSYRVMNDTFKLKLCFFPEVGNYPSTSQDSIKE